MKLILRYIWKVESVSRRKVYFRFKSPSFYSDEMLSLEISIINTVSAVLIFEGGGGGGGFRAKDFLQKKTKKGRVRGLC